jgi:NADPH-dependent 2,4-dienoyl-CoA reductase/sulfur reductase-like enzyme/pSer/pThr/pTyr-binding forkhead associated (FHA) protein
MSRRRYIVVGDGAAGFTAAEALRAQDPTCAIGVVSDDPNPAYFRAALTNFLLGELREHQIWAVSPSFYADNRLSRLHARAGGLDAQRSVLWLESGGPPQPYDGLVVATGSRPRAPSFEGASLGGVAALRTLQDARFVMDRVTLTRLSRAVVIGGGPLALEWAVALRERGVAVTLLVREARLMGASLDPVGSDLVVARLRSIGVDVRLGDEVARAVPDRSGWVSAIVTKQGHDLPCQLVGVAIGVVCNTEWLKDSGVALGKTGGVVVDDRMATSVANVVAAGDVAEHKGALLQLWEPARRQGLVAARHLAGLPAKHAPGAHYLATRLGDLDFAAVGRTRPDPALEEIVDRSSRPGRIAYRKLYVDKGRLVGALLLGQREERVRARGRLYKELVDTGLDVTPVKRALLDPGFDVRGWMGTRAILEKPEAPAAGARPATSVLRGTQVLALASLARPQAPAVAEVPLPEGPRAPLTIGLRAPAPVAPTGPALAFLEGPFGRREVRGPVFGLGRDPAGQVVLDDPAASFVHAQIVEHGGHFYLRDAGSRNGTFVSGAPVTVPHALRDGDRVRIGATDMVFRSPGAAGAPPPPAPSQFFAAAESAGIAALEVRAGPCAGLRFPLAASPVTIGRDEGCGVRLDDLSVSRRHAVLTQIDGRWHVSDLSSSRGTVKNGAPLLAGRDVPLAHGDVLALGDSVLAFSLAPAAVPPSGPATASRPAA